MDIHDYLIEQECLDWGKLLAPWHETLPSKFTLWMVNRFGEPILALDDGSIWILSLDEGNLKKVADSRDEFCDLADQGNNGNEWFFIPLVDELVAAGITLKHGECYGFTLPPVVGGKYELGNVRPKPLGDYYGFLADFYRQIADVPDGGTITFEIVR